MATYATLTIPVLDIIGSEFNASRANVWIEPNVPVVLADSIRVGGRREQVVNGVATFANLVTTNSADNPASFGYVVTITAPPKGARAREDIVVLTTSDFPFTATANLKDIDEAWDNITAPVSWRSAFMDQAQDLLDAQVAIAGPVDATVAALMKNTGGVGPLTSAALDTAASRAASLGLRSSLAAPLTTGFSVIGDSTGNETTEWAYLLAQDIATAYPAYTVQHVLWSDTTTDTTAATVIQTGTAGAQYLNCATGVATRSLPLAASLHTPAVVDVRAKVKMTDWTPATVGTLVAREGGSGKRSWYFGVHTTGKLAFFYSVDGTNLITDRLSDTVVSAADGDTLWVRAVYTPATTLKYYTSTDGITWTQLGADVSLTSGGIATGSVFDAAHYYELGGRQGSIGSPASLIYEVDVRDGLAGKSIVPRLPALWGAVAANPAPVAGAPVFTVVNGSHPGADLAYWTQTRIEKALPAYGQRIGFVSLSHNELAQSGPSFASRYASTLALVKARMPGVPLIALTQNPQKAPRTTEDIKAQAARRADIFTSAASAGAVSIDTFAAFEAAGVSTTVSNTDGVHPTTTGSQVWRDAVKSGIGL